MDQDALNFYGFFELEASLSALEGAPDVKFILNINTCTEIPAAKLSHRQVFESFNDLDLRRLSLTLNQSASELRKLVGPARIDFAVGGKNQGVGFTAGDLANVLCYYLG